MAAVAQHFMIRLRDDRVIAPTPEARRVVARAVLEAGRGERLFAFNAGDTHIHGGAACTYDGAAQLARRIEIRIGNNLRPGVRFARAHIRPIENQHHLVRAFFYILGQREHHGYTGDRFHDGSNLVDLLGLRVLGTYTVENVRALMPRVRRADLLQVLGVPTLEPIAPGEGAVLAAATMAASGLEALDGRSAEVVAARRAAVHAAGGRISSAEMGRALGCGARTVKRMKNEKPVPELVRAIQLQSALRAALPADDGGLPVSPSSTGSGGPRS